MPYKDKDKQREWQRNYMRRVSRTEKFKANQKRWRAAHPGYVAAVVRRIYYRKKAWREEVHVLWESVLTVRLAEVIKRLETDATTHRPADTVLAAKLWQKLHGTPWDESARFLGVHPSVLKAWGAQGGIAQAEALIAQWLEQALDAHDAQAEQG